MEQPPPRSPPVGTRVNVQLFTNGRRSAPLVVYLHQPLAWDHTISQMLKVSKTVRSRGVEMANISYDWFWPTALRRHWNFLLATHALANTDFFCFPRVWRSRRSRSRRFTKGRSLCCASKVRITGHLLGPAPESTLLPKCTILQRRGANVIEASRGGYV